MPINYDYGNVVVLENDGVLFGEVAEPKTSLLASAGRKFDSHSGHIYYLLTQDIFTLPF